MPARRQIVSSYQPTRQELFDQQFWPVFMALCITATILAATIVSLLAGFWMWVSLMVLPAAVAALLICLRFVDDRRVRRSMQLAVILSLAAHCLFLIVAKQSSVFRGVFREVIPNTTPVKPQRMINISRQTARQPWNEVNPTPTLTADAPQPEKRENVDTAVARAQPPPVERQQPSENPQLIRRQQTSQSLPKLGQSLSQVHRQANNVQPKSSDFADASAPAPKASAPPADRPSPTSTELVKSPASSSAVQPDRTGDNPARIAVSESESRRADTPMKPQTRSTTAIRPVPTPPSRMTPKISEVAPASPTPSPASPVASPASKPRQVATNVERQSPSAVADRKIPEEVNPRNRVAEMSSRLQPRESQTRPAIDRELSAIRPRRSSETAAQPVSPAVTESPSASRDVAVHAESMRLQPQAMAIDKSTAGTAGVGRAANLDRDLGSTQSAATSPANSLNRRERTTSRPDAASLTLQQAAEVPVASASEITPSSSLRPDPVLIASRSASRNIAELSASSSASLKQADSQTSRSEVSAEKGSGAADMGSMRIVTEIASQRVEGGGQPEINHRISEQPVVRESGGGASIPSIATGNSGPEVADNRVALSLPLAADRPNPSAESSLNTQPDRFQTESGEAKRPPIDDNRLSEMSREPDGSMQARDDGSAEEDEELQRQLKNLAQSLEGTSPAIDRGAVPEISETGEATSPQPLPRQKAASDRIGSAASLAENAVRQPSGDSSAGAKKNPEKSADVAATARIPGGRPVRREQADSRPGTGSIAEIAPSAETPVSGGAEPSINEPLAELPGRVVAGAGRSSNVNDASKLTELDRDEPAGMSLLIEARPGPAGVADLPQPDAGVDSRLASRESPALQPMTETRFRKPETGGTPSINSSPTIAREAFRSRTTSEAASESPQTEESIELGLAFLARYQQDDGSWTLGGFDLDRNDRATMMSSDTAATGLALLAFQGAGYHHREFRYASRLQQAVTWLVDNQQPNGELFVEADEDSNNFARLYSHAIATLALAEAYGMTQDESLRAPVQHALDYIAGTQDLQLGGWRYRPGKGSDTSVTGWMVMALQSGRLAGLETDPRAFANARRWMDSAEDASLSHLYRYNPSARDSEEVRRAHGRVPSPCMTSVGLLMRLYTDWKKSDPRFSDGAAYLLQHLPNDSTIEQRDTYYWYYATQILRHIGGNTWETWHSALHPLLVNSQIRSGEMAGSWDPLNPVPDRWGAHGGRLYVTTMNLLSLEVDYRLLPLYEEAE